LKSQWFVRLLAIRHITAIKSITLYVGYVVCIKKEQIHALKKYDGKETRRSEKYIKVGLEESRFN
jgi:hypothetical protein